MVLNTKTTIMLAALAAMTLQTGIGHAADANLPPSRVNDSELLKVRTDVPKGDYALARIEAPIAWLGADGKLRPPQSATLVAGFRDGTLVTFWAVDASSGTDPWRLRRSTARLTGRN